ncbi:hypothetical protein I4641_23385 [Waterburya agarophytonicola K14]|uniref:Uncharacterized protein n=1 Tax=Waterburya agarophytonicola KI4 TaxID=2874699 RepID=A0A964BU73_9CYAN|nr:hypothetical protein [Waterburya agarophytonicola]MCC0179884.1 hypothetical protein [Waterburya agarophytonicola KI4]
MVNFQNAPIAYGSANTAALKNSVDDLYYQADRVKNRILLDFGLVNKDQRVGMQLSNNGVNCPCLIKSVHAASGSSTNDGLVWEIHSKLNAGVQDRIALQYVDQRDAPFDHPEFVLLPEYVIYVIPGQDSYPRIVLEPINLLIHGITKN